MIVSSGIKLQQGHFVGYCFPFSALNQEVYNAGLLVFLVMIIYLVQVVFIRFFHCKVNIFPL